MDSIKQTAVAVRVLFLSFTATIWEMVEGKVTEADLASGRIGQTGQVIAF